MDRRALLKLGAALTLAGCQSTPHTPSPSRHVVIVGAGIVGAAIAYHLAKAGQRVTVLDQEAPASHASHGTFGWINATWAKQPQDYHRLNQAGVSGWHELQATLGLPIRWGGSLEWFADKARQQQLDEQLREQVAWGEPARMVTPSELAVLEPAVNFGGNSAAFSGNDGALDAVFATRRLLAAAQQLGAELHYPCRAIRALEQGGHLQAVQTCRGPLPADQLVLATGAGSQWFEALAGITIPQRPTPGIILITEPLPPLLGRVIAAPGVHLHQREDGRVVLGEQAGAPGNPAHAERLQHRPRRFPDKTVEAQHAARLLALGTAFVPALQGAKAEQVLIGWRPLPLDGHPVLGRSPAKRDVYLAIMHSGVSLAPIVGQLAALELSREQPLARLAAYRPDRDFRRVVRY